MVVLVVIAERERKALTMPVRRDPRTGKWFFRTKVKLPNGEMPRLFGTPGVPGAYQDLPNTQVGAREAEQRAIKSALSGATVAILPPVAKEVPTFQAWFEGRFWNEWVIARKNTPSEVEQKETIFKAHLSPEFGKLRLDEIDVAAIAKFRSKLVKRGDLAEKTINNILGVLSSR